MRGLTVAKRHKRLLIVAEDGATLYAMPDFLKPLPSRAPFEALARELAEGGGIGAIMRFETRWNPKAVAHGRAA